MKYDKPVRRVEQLAKGENEQLVALLALREQRT